MQLPRPRATRRSRRGGDVAPTSSTLVLLVALSVALVAAPAPALDVPASSTRTTEPYGTVSPWTTVPHPGHPEGIVVDGRRVHVTTTTGADGVVVGDGIPSRVFTFDLDGNLLDEVVLEGEDTGTLHGAAGIVRDAEGRRYVALSPYPHPVTGSTGAAVVRLDDRGRQELYALLPDLPPCPGVLPGPCSPAAGDRGPLANDIVFDAAGNLYVSDSFQATVWRVPRGGGVADPWLQDASLDGLLVGANGLRVSPDGRSLVLAVTANLGVAGTIHRVPLVDRPTGADMEVVHRWLRESPDGITFGRSGRLYVVLGEGVLSVLDPDGTEVSRITSDLLHNPASPAFHDRSRSLLVTNHAFDDPDPAHQTVVRIAVDDTGVPLARPCIGTPARRCSR